MHIDRKSGLRGDKGAIDNLLAYSARMRRAREEFHGRVARTLILALAALMFWLAMRSLGFA